MRRLSTHLRSVLVVVLLGLALSPSGASAHSALQSSSPRSGGHLDAAPRAVRLAFTAPVETSFGAIRVVDARGRAVHARTVTRGRTTVTALERGLGEGLYTVTYRVISADSHPISGVSTFSVGRAGAARAHDLPARPEAAGRLPEAAGRLPELAGPVTTAALGAARATQYAAIALGIGTLVFLVACWLPAVREASGASPEWREATEIFARRARTLLTIAGALGVTSAMAAIALQGAVVTARPLRSALDPTTLTEVLQTRFGTVWGLGTLLWLSVAIAVSLPAIRAPVLRAATLGATGLGLPSARRLALLGAPLAGLAFLPALGGHAAAQDPLWLLVPANVLHVLGASAWMGGVAVLVYAVGPAVRALAPPLQPRLLSLAVGRFSTLAGVSVALILLSGIAQSLVAVDSWGALLETAYGRSLLVKSALFAILIAAGWMHRARMLPSLKGATCTDAAPQAPTALMFRLLRVEMAVLVGVLAVTGALATYAPATMS